MAKKNTKKTKSLEATLWDAADKLRGNLEAAEYKHVVLGLVFLKYVSDAFETRRTELEATIADPESSEYIKNEERREKILESRDEYTSQNVFWVPQEARWASLLAQAKQPEIGVLIDSAMDAIEKENPTLKGVLPKTYARAEIDKRLLGELVDLIGTIGFTEVDHGADDVLGRVYEYFLGRFASSEGRGAGEFYTPRSVVRLLVEMLEPYKGRVFDPCCGSGGMFVQSAEFVAAHGGKRTDISVYGQEFVATTWRLAKMNLALRGIEANLADESADSFHKDKFPDLRADYIIANPPFNMDDWYSDALREDPRWKYGRPPAGNGNFAWVQHFLHHLAPSGTAGFVLANGSLASKADAERQIRKNLVEAGVVECVVALPEKLFFNTPIPVTLWFLTKRRSPEHAHPSEALFIDATRLGYMADRTVRAMSDADIERICNTYHAWQGTYTDGGPYRDVVGFCASVGREAIESSRFDLSPGRYVTAIGGEGIDETGLVALSELRLQLANEVKRSAAIYSKIDSLIEEIEG